MNTLSFIPDHRIKASNVLVELPISEYIQVARDIIDKNEFQRKRVITSRLKKSLKNDLKHKCTIPPIVLGVGERYLPENFDYRSFNNKNFIEKLIKEKKVIILDGLQRTYVLLELNNEEPEGDWMNQMLRCEVYIGVEKLGILYRMLTLNTGQTTMSTRHLLEILYFDYLNAPLDNDVKLFLDRDENRIKNPLKEYKFKDIIEGYNSFINGREVPIERGDILQNIETLNSLERTDADKEGFKNFLSFFHSLLQKLEKVCSFQFDYNKIQGSEYDLSSNPFGKNTVQIFGKPQSLTGLGASLRLIKKNRGLSLENLKHKIESIHLPEEMAIYKLLLIFDHIKNKSKKVGNDQRFFFKILFNRLFDPEAESYLDLSLSIDEAYKRVEERLEE